MATNGIKVNMAPSHPGDFIRTEVIEELGLNMTKASQILGVRRATLLDMLLRMQVWYAASQIRARANEVRVRRYVPA